MTDEVSVCGHKYHRWRLDIRACLDCLAAKDARIAALEAENRKLLWIIKDKDACLSAMLNRAMTGEFFGIKYFINAAQAIINIGALSVPGDGKAEVTK